MKKLLLAAAIAVGASTIVAQLPEQQLETHAKSVTVRVELDNPNGYLNVRSGPSQKKKVVGQVKNGTYLYAIKSVYNKKEKKYYSLIRYKGKKAYVSNRYLLPVGPGAADDI